jgi:hypothetical protein
VAKYNETFTQQLSAFAKHAAAVVDWVRAAPADAADAPAHLDRGSAAVDVLAGVVGTLVAMSEVPLKAVPRQLAAVKEQFGAVAFAMLNPSTADALVADDLVESVRALGDVVKAMVALNVLAHRGSVRACDAAGVGLLGGGQLSAATL